MVSAPEQLTEDAGLDSCKITIHGAKKAHTAGTWPS